MRTSRTRTLRNTHRYAPGRSPDRQTIETPDKQTRRAREAHEKKKGGGGVQEPSLAGDTHNTTTESIAAVWFVVPVTSRRRGCCACTVRTTGRGHRRLRRKVRTSQTRTRRLAGGRYAYATGRRLR